MTLAEPLAARFVALSEILIGLAASPLPTHLLQTLAEHAEAAVACDYFAICFKDADDQGYVVHPLAGVASEHSAPRLFAMAEGRPESAVREGRVIRITDLLTTIDTASPLERTWIDHGLRSVLGVPVRHGVETVGVLVFARGAVASFTSDDEQIASLLAAGLAGALEASRAYQVLADERTTLAAVVGSMQDAVLVVNPDGVVLLANPAVRGMLGIDADSATGESICAVVDDGPLRGALAAGKPGTADVALGDGRTAEASVVPVSTSYGEAVGFAAILRDVSVLKDLAQMKNDFVNTVSHDLKTPLTVIASAADLLLQDVPPDSRAAVRCEMILKAATYMGGLVRDLLDLGKIESRLEVPRDPVDLPPLVTDVVARLEPEAAAKGVTITAIVPTRAIVLGLAARLEQALLNLIGNAVKYTRAGGQVTVSAKTTGDAASPAVVVSVADTGIGIPAANVPYVFDKFYRVRNASTQGIEGTGLGLAIAKGIVEAHGGRIHVESREGQGTTFTLSLPARQS